MIIVTSVGRAGTSAIMEWLKESGMNTGNINLIPGYDAGNEHPKVTQINGQFRKMVMDGKHLDKKFDCWKQYQSISELDISVAKDPQFLVHPEIIAQWNHARGDIKVLWLRRDPVDIAKSQRRVEFMNTPAYRCFADLIERHEERFQEVLDEFKIPYEQLWFPDFMEQKDRVRKIVKEYKGSGGKKIKDKQYNEAWDRVFEPTMVHIERPGKMEIRKVARERIVPSDEQIVRKGTELIGKTIREAMKVEENLIRQVLQDYLHKAPTNEEVKKHAVILKYYQNDKQYWVSWDGVVLGRVDKEWGPLSKFTAKFTPQELISDEDQDFK